MICNTSCSCRTLCDAVYTRVLLALEAAMRSSFKPGDWIPTPWLANEITRQFALFGVKCGISVDGLRPILGDGFRLEFPLRITVQRTVD
jgi:hypothetical protein